MSLSVVVDPPPTTTVAGDNRASRQHDPGLRRELAARFLPTPLPTMRPSPSISRAPLVLRHPRRRVPKTLSLGPAVLLRFMGKIPPETALYGRFSGILFAAPRKEPFQ